MAPSEIAPAPPISVHVKSVTITEVELDLETEDEAVTMERKRLRLHIGLGETPQDPPRDPPKFQPLFFIEKAPESRTGTACQLPGCTQRIESGELRLALNPSMQSENWFKASSDFYHIGCFEKIADFSDAQFLDRIQPVTRNTWRQRGLKASSVLDGCYLVSGGVERLVLEWKFTRGRWIDKRDGVYNEWEEQIDPELESLLNKAGSAMYKPSGHPAMYKPSGRPAMLDNYEYYNLAVALAPYESDGPNDRDEWNLFTKYLDTTVEAMRNPHDLSEMLAHWKSDMTLAWKDPRKKGDTPKEAKRVLGDKAIRALKRLSAIPLPQVESNPFSSGY